jgi:CDP-glucose 4,6-dehydratase
MAILREELMKGTNMREVLSSFSGKRVFVTGHTGFKGSWLTYLLTMLGADVKGYSHPPKQESNHFEILGLDNKIQHLIGDIADFSSLNEAMQSFQPEYVFHLAAQALVKKSYKEPVETFQTNIMGSVHVLEAVRQCSAVRSLVYITSDKCYENLEWVWGYRESDRLGGHDPYSASKGAAELVFSAYASSFYSTRSELGAATTRAGNVIGGGDWSEDRIVPDCIRAAKVDASIVLRSPESTRPWQHVLEPISGYLLLAAQLRQHPQDFSGSWNFGPSTEEVRTVSEVAHTIISHLGQGSVEIDGSLNQHHEANLLQLNCDKSHQLLGWYPRWGVEKTLMTTVEWYKTWLDGMDVEDVTHKQIEDYFQELT